MPFWHARVRKFGMNSMELLRKKCEIREYVSFWTLIVKTEHVVDSIVVCCPFKYHTDTSFCRIVSCRPLFTFDTVW